METRLYQAKNFEHLYGTPGFSDRLLKSHFKLYEGYVKNTNELAGFFESFSGEPADYGGSAFAEAKRRFGWEFNGMRLHEYYFANMGKSAVTPHQNSSLAEKISEDFGSIEDWHSEFMRVGTMRGIGWAILTYDVLSNRLMNVWINEHDLGHLAGTSPLLVMDVFEHAFITDYGMERDKYIAAFWKAIRWEEVQHRFDSAAKAEAFL